MRRNILNVLCVIGAPLFESTLAPRRSIAFRNSAGTWSRAPGKQFGVLDRWRDRHTRPARWSDTLRIRPVRWRKWNRIRIDLARLADPIDKMMIICNDMLTSWHGDTFYIPGSLYCNNAQCTTKLLGGILHLKLSSANMAAILSRGRWVNEWRKKNAVNFYLWLAKICQFSITPKVDSLWWYVCCMIWFMWQRAFKFTLT